MHRHWNTAAGVLTANGTGHEGTHRPDSALGDAFSSQGRSNTGRDSSEQLAASARKLHQRAEIWFSESNDDVMKSEAIEHARQSAREYIRAGEILQAVVRGRTPEELARQQALEICCNNLAVLKGGELIACGKALPLRSLQCRVQKRFCT